MAIAVGDKIPDVEVKTLGEDGMPAATSTADVLGQGKVVLFAVPGAFTPGCTKQHLPGFVDGAEALADKGVDRIACVAVNDAWVLDAWARSQNAEDKITMLADGNADFTKAVGLDMDGSGAGLGLRSQRYAMVIDDGVVTRLDVEPETGVTVSSCDAVAQSL